MHNKFDIYFFITTVILLFNVIYISASYNGESIPILLVKLLARDKTSEMQMAAARCLTYLCRGGALQPSDNIIMFKVNLRYLVIDCKLVMP
jgi:hypothetical protein